MDFSFIEPHTSYIICSTPRSGSTFLCDALASTGVCGIPREYFLPSYWAVHKPVQLRGISGIWASSWLMPPVFPLTKLLSKGATRNGVFGVKIMQSHFDFVVQKLRSMIGGSSCSPVDVLTNAFPNLHYIFMTRNDKIRQTVSLAKALQSGQWYSGPFATFERLRKGFTKRKNLTYEFQQLFSLYEVVQSEEKSWERYFSENKIQPLTISYESLTGELTQTIGRILDFLKIDSATPIPLEKIRLRRQSDVINQEWAERFTRDLKDRSTSLFRE